MRLDPALPRLPGRLALAAACGLALLLALAPWLALRPTGAPAPAGPPGASFEPARALAHVRALARAPRPVASEATAAARRYLTDQIRGLGLTPEIQTETVQTASSDMMANVRVSLAVVHNVLVRLPGSGPRGRPAVLASAHYDSGPDSLGAADGALSAAALLEALRVLRAGPPPDNDLLFVFTDADQAHALGTRGFAQSHPWAQRARIVLRFDNFGDRGPLELVDASQADDAAIDAWAGLAGAARGSSFMAELTRGAPQRIAGRLLARDGASVLQFATLGGTLGPDGIHDLPERLSPDSLRHEGDTALALLRHFGNAPLPPPLLPPLQARGQVYATLPLIGGLRYATAWVWPLSALACLLAVLACARALRQGAAGVDIVQATFGFAFMTVFAGFSAYLCRESLPQLEARYGLALLAADGGADRLACAFLLLAAAVFIVLQRHLQNKLGAATAALGMSLALTVGLLLTSAAAPGASYLLAWPLLAAQAAWLLLASRRAQGWSAARRIAVHLAGALPALLLLPPAALDSIRWLSPEWLPLPVLLVCAAAGLAGMALEAIGRRFVAIALALGGAACLGLAYGATPRAPELPAPNRLVYFKDTPSWQAYWMYPALPLDAWTRKVFPNTRHPYLLPYIFGVTSKPVWYAAAPRNDAIAYPYLITEKSTWAPGTRHVEFLLRSNNRAPEITLRLSGADPLRTSVNGRVLTDAHYRGWRLDLHGMQDQDLHFAFDLLGHGTIAIFVQEHIPGLPERDLPPRPDGLPPLLPLTGTTVSSDILLFR
jgi:hypothetical protein